MDEETAKAIARQLRKPEGKHGLVIGEKMNESNFHMNRYAMDALHMKSNELLLEIGMGNGLFVPEILSADPSIRYIGCDYSPEMVEEASKLNEEYVKTDQAKFFLTSAHNLPFEDSFFDKILTVNTIYFWENPEKELSEIRRVLKMQGELVIAVRPKKVMETYPFVKHGFRTYSKEELVLLLEQNNFKLTDMLEKQEPDMVLQTGEKVKAESLIVSCRK